MNGLTLDQLAERTQTGRDRIATVVSDEVDLGHILRDGDRYRLAAGFEAEFGPVLREGLNAIGDRPATNPDRRGLEARVLDHLARHPSGQRVADVAAGVRADRKTVREAVFGLVAAGSVTRHDGFANSNLYRLAVGERLAA